MVVPVAESDAVPVPIAFVARTLKSYETPWRSPETVAGGPDTGRCAVHSDATPLSLMMCISPWSQFVLVDVSPPLSAPGDPTTRAGLPSASIITPTEEPNASPSEMVLPRMFVLLSEMASSMLEVV